MVLNRWAQRFEGLFDDGNPQVVRRLQQGRNLLASGRVTGVQVNRGAVSASVQGFSATPLAVEITLPVLTDDEWTLVVGALASQVRHRARLLAGQVPDGSDSQLEGHGLSLIPRRSELDVTCRCGDAVVPCMHAAGVWLAVARAIDEDPFTLLKMRGRGRERLLADSATVRGGGTAAVPAGQPLGSLPVAAWLSAARDVDDLVPAAPAAPRTSAGPLRLLGDPPGWTGGVSAGDLFAPLVTRGATWAAALLDDPAAEPPPTAND